MEQEGYGYDVISVDKILNVIQKLDSIEERSKILQFVYLKLKKAELDEECHKYLVNAELLSDNFATYGCR